MFEISHVRKLVFAVSALFFMLAVIPVIVHWWRGRNTLTKEEERAHYVEVGQSLDRRSKESQTTPTTARDEKEVYYEEVTHSLDRRSVSQ